MEQLVVQCKHSLPLTVCTRYILGISVPAFKGCQYIFQKHYASINEHAILFQLAPHADNAAMRHLSDDCTGFCNRIMNFQKGYATGQLDDARLFLVESKVELARFFLNDREQLRHFAFCTVRNTVVHESDILLRLVSILDGMIKRVWNYKREVL